MQLLLSFLRTLSYFFVLQSQDGFKGEGYALVEKKEDDGVVDEEEELDVSEVIVDQSSPVTQIRLTLPGQQPVVATFNCTHTVAHIRRYVNRTFTMTRTYHLLQLRPNQRLDDPNISIVDAKLEKSTIQIVVKE